MKVTVAGAGYVGLSNALILSKNFEVIIFDINENKVRDLNAGISPLQEDEIKEFLKRKGHSLSATIEESELYKNVDYLLIATPTDYNEQTNFFDTSSVDKIVSEALKQNSKIKIVIRSTLPVGHTESLIKLHKNNNIVFMPEFLREGMSLYDSLFPSRLVLGGDSGLNEEIFSMFLSVIEKQNVEFISTNPSEAEAIKLFSNTYLAMRVSFFNELDSYSAFYGLKSSEIIKGVCLDERIGLHYNNPSFGYGGYCLPKDTKQLLANFKDVPQTLMDAIVKSNEVRIKFIVQEILEKNVNTIGIYQLAMKSGSDNFRFSSTLKVIEQLKKENVHLIIYEPSISTHEFEGITVINDFDIFSRECDLIVANRFTNELTQVSKKVFSRDIFHID